MSFFDDDTETTESNNHFIWVEKYRPVTLDKYLGNESFKDTIKEYLSKGEIPHILLHSHKPGTGKTTLAKMIAKNIPCDVLYINASDENSVENIRNKVKGFASTLGFNKLKILILDECDRITLEGQDALRNMMETFSDHTRFILTCNYVEKVREPIVSRCQTFHVQPPEKATVAKHVAGILDAEGIPYEVDDFKVLMKYYPDIRRIIQTAQQSSTSGRLKITKKQVVESDAKIKLVEILKSNISEKDKLRECRQMMADNNIGDRADFTEYFDYLYENVDEYAPKSVANTIIAIAEHQYKDAFVPNKEINFASCIVTILKGM